MTGKHGHEESNTEVPRRTLVQELEDRSDLHDTRDLGRDELCWEIAYES